MRTKLLILAIFLATLMNGILLYELPLFNKSFANDIAVNVDKPSADSPKINTPKVDLKAETQPTDKVVGVILPYRYSRWEYRRFEPLRNLIRCHHNRKLLRTSFFYVI